MNVPNPNCPRHDCRYVVGVEMTTSMYYQPVYNKHGQNVNPDGNVTSGEMTCSTCNRKWTYKTQYGNTTYKEVSQQNPISETPSVQTEPVIVDADEGIKTITTSTVFIGN